MHEKTKGVKRALLPGRFQPPHWGHFRLIKWVLERFDEVIIVIGSAQKSHSFSNPFTAGERIEMLRLGLKDVGIDLSRVFMIPVTDIETNFVWPRWVEMFVPRFDCVVSGNPLVARLFFEYGYCVITPPMFDRERYSATVVRRLMLKGDAEWRSLVPPSVAEYIESIGGVERLRRVTEV
ncbi:nicotinamide-nucleotide adenylyltransferase [Pyrolobus fumarii 1A]|uniref:Nicotinamide-nucleotide adenylyltransferase n=1 Tax=Pyrolobus fumarii (strain DSM 11204 / 1A) TaxID=694429 RepID=G0EEW6_PYRF1|nr:nicotinamide-nucleotide adenylyltransferase [Pyrolobus fumarii]AEM38080.1 nicotinamide-nucleotide adenylyltransferase [Pyrolobus fumarii 1A]